jgi:hypothetical protein
MDLAELPPSPTPSCSSKLSDTEKRVLEPYEDDHELEEGEIHEERPSVEAPTEEIEWCEGTINSLTVTKENKTALHLEYCKKSGEIRLQAEGEFAVSYEDFLQYIDEVTGNYRKNQMKDEFERIEQERDEEFDDICFYSLMVMVFTVGIMLSIFMAIYA